MQFMCLAALLRPMSYYEELHSAELKECHFPGGRPPPAIILTDELGEEKVVFKGYALPAPPSLGDEAKISIAVSIKF